MVDYHYWSLEVLRAEAGNTFTACKNKDGVRKQVQGARQISDKPRRCFGKQERRKEAENGILRLAEKTTCALNNGTITRGTTDDVGIAQSNKIGRGVG